MARKPQPFIDDPLRFDYPEGPVCNARIGTEPFTIRIMGCRARVLLAVHLHQGTEFEDICKGTGLSVRVAQRPLSALVRWGLVRQHGREVRITSLGSTAAQRVLHEFNEAKRKAGRAEPTTPTPSTTGDSIHARPEEAAA